MKADNLYIIHIVGSESFVDEASRSFPCRLDYTTDRAHAMGFPSAIAAAMWSVLNVVHGKIDVVMR